MGWKLVPVEEPAPGVPDVATLKVRVLAIMEEIERTFPDADPDLFEEMRKGLDEQMGKNADKVPRIHALCVEAMSRPMTDARDAGLAPAARAKAEALRGVDNIGDAIKACNYELKIVARALASIGVFGLRMWFKEREDGGGQERLGKVPGCVRRCLALLEGGAPGAPDPK